MASFVVRKSLREMLWALMPSLDHTLIHFEQAIDVLEEFDQLDAIIYFLPPDLHASAKEKRIQLQTILNTEPPLAVHDDRSPRTFQLDHDVAVMNSILKLSVKKELWIARSAKHVVDCHSSAQMYLFMKSYLDNAKLLQQLQSPQSPPLYQQEITYFNAQIVDHLGLVSDDAPPTLQRGISNIVALKEFLASVLLKDIAGGVGADVGEGIGTRQPDVNV